MYGRINTSYAKMLFNESQNGVSGGCYHTVLFPKLSYLAYFFGIRGCPYSIRRVFSQLLWKELGLFVEKSGWRFKTDMMYGGPGGRILHLLGSMMVHPRYWRIDLPVAKRYLQLEADTPGDIMALSLTLSEPYNGYSVNAGMYEMLHTGHLPLLSVHSLTLWSSGLASALLKMQHGHDDQGERSDHFPGIICAGERVRLGEWSGSPHFRLLYPSLDGLECEAISREFNHWSGILAAVKLPKKKTGITSGC
jgi:hypothetical protein